MNTISLFKPYINNKAVSLVVETLKSGWVGEGKKVQEFERELGKITQSKYPVCVNSGTSALHLALILAGVGRNDEVVTTAQTMFATAQSILAVGAKPVFADILYDSGNVDPEDVKKKITSRTKAILSVDWGGYPCDYDELLDIARENKLVLVEDAAHALGAAYRGKPIGSVSPITCFSFQAIKHITTGDGGLVTVSNQKDYRKCIRLRWFGIDRFKRKPSILGEPIFDIKELGFKYHMNDIAASIGLGNVEDIQKILKKRDKIVRMYRTHLKSVPGIELFEEKEDRKSAHWLFSIHVQKRKDFCKMMKSRGIEVSVVHLRIDRNTILKKMRSSLPVLEKFSQTHVSLPLHQFLTEEDVLSIIGAIKKGW